jgi:hypothetical protein
MDLQRMLILSGAQPKLTPEQQVLSEMAQTKGGEFKQLDVAAQKVWAAKGDAKKAALVSLIKGFKFKGKQEAHLAKAEMMDNPTKMDKFAADLMQVGHGNKVV